MADNAFTLNTTDAIAHLQLTRPDSFNTLNDDFWRRLPQVLQQLNDEGSARAVIIASTGKHFSAGMDLAVFAGLLDADPTEAARRNEKMMHMLLRLQRTLTQIEQLRMPVLAAIQGGCIGGALDLVSACDMRYCTRDAFFVIEETKLGITADLGTLQRLPHIMPSGLVRELAYTGRRLMADEALSAGLVNKVFDTQEEMLAGVNAIAADIAKHSPLAVSGSKHMLNYSRDHSVADSLQTMAFWQSGMFQPQGDLNTALQAKMSKQEAQFDDLAPLSGLIGE